ncbi:MAG: KH domain-containing protein [Chloroflexi bacterium]|nr:KH domain-containing protein [Chloroflexota bacterium]
MKDLVTYMATSLVDEPEAVHVTETLRNHFTVVQLSVAPDDMGRIIGKKGRIAKAMRILMNVASVKEGRPAVLEIG